jgi:hypothetical protein
MKSKSYSAIKFSTQECRYKVLAELYPLIQQGSVYGYV